MPEETTPIKHPSFGLIAFDRTTYAQSLDGSGQERPLFGSSILHNSCITVKIQRAELQRNLNEDRIFAVGSPPIVEVEMSVTQFADAITSLNQGDGTPCTIVMVDGKRIQPPPFENKRVQFDREFTTEMQKITSKTNEFYSEIGRILSKSSLGKHDREEITKQLDLLRQEITSNVPFIKGQFTEQMDQTVLEAKNEFSAYVDVKIKQLGLEGFKKELTQLRKESIASLESKEEKSSA